MTKAQEGRIGFTTWDGVTIVHLGAPQVRKTVQSNKSNAIIRIEVFNRLRPLKVFEGVRIGPFENEAQCERIKTIVAELIPKFRWYDPVNYEGKQRPRVWTSQIENSDGEWFVNVVRLPENKDKVMDYLLEVESK